MRDLPRVGDRVLVPWGFDEVEATVLDVHGPAGQPHLLLRVAVEGSQGEPLEELTVSFPASSVRPAAAA